MSMHHPSWFPSGDMGPAGGSYLARIVSGSIDSMNQDDFLHYLRMREAMVLLHDDRHRRYTRPTAPSLLAWLVAFAVYAGVGARDVLRCLFRCLATALRVVTKAKQRCGAMRA